VNGDGRLDLISPDYNENAQLVFMNKGNGSFAPAVSYKVGGNPYWVAAADINRDGKVDLISANSYDNADGVDEQWQRHFRFQRDLLGGQQSALGHRGGR
jgi:hypothetical protein